MLTLVLGFAKDMVLKYFDRKRAEADAAIEISRQRVMAEIDWDVQQAEASKHSWKDEFWTIILGAPLLVGLFPPAQKYVDVENFFRVMETAPDWYVAGVGAAMAAAFGMRQLAKFNNKPR